MKNTKKHIDELFKQLEHDAFIVPESFLEDLNTRLDAQLLEKKKKRKPVFWFFISGIVGVLVISMVGFYNYFNNHKDEKFTAFQKKEDNERIPSKESIGDKKVAEHNQFQISDSKMFELKASEKIKSTDLKIIQSRPILIITREKSNVTPLFTESQKTDQIIQSPKLSDRSPMGDSGNENVYTKGEKISTKNKSIDSVQKVSDKFSIFMHPKEPYFRELNQDLEKSVVTIKEPDKEIETKLNQKLWQYDVQFYGGASQAFWKMKSNSDTSFSSVERTLCLSPAFGLKANAFYKNMNMSLGLEYYQSNQVLSFNSLEIGEVGVDSTIIGHEFDTITGDTIYIYQINPIYDSVLVTQNIKNNYSWFSIPISFGYRFKFNSWSIIPRAGVNFNFGIAENRGKYPNTNFGSSSYEAVRFNLDLMIQTEIRKNFNQFHVFLTPYYRGNLSPMLKSPSFSISHQSWGVNVGFGFSF